MIVEGVEVVALKTWKVCQIRCAEASFDARRESLGPAVSERNCSLFKPG